MSISQRKPFSSLMLQFRLKIKEVQINEETFSPSTIFILDLGRNFCIIIIDLGRNFF